MGYDPVDPFRNCPREDPGDWLVGDPGGRDLICRIAISRLEAMSISKDLICLCVFWVGSANQISEFRSAEVLVSSNETQTTFTWLAMPDADPD